MVTSRSQKGVRPHVGVSQYEIGGGVTSRLPSLERTEPFWNPEHSPPPPAHYLFEVGLKEGGVLEMVVKAGRVLAARWGDPLWWGAGWQPNHGNCLGRASVRTQGVQRSKEFVVVLKTQMAKLEIFVSCTTPTFPRRIPPNPNFTADNISSRPNQHLRVGNICLPKTQISKLKKHFTQDHI